MNNISNKKVFIGGLDRKTTEKEAFAYISDIIKPIFHFALKKKKSRSSMSLGYAILTTNKETFNKLIGGPPIYFNGRKLECKPFLKGEALTVFNLDFNKRRIFINNLPEGTSDEELKQIFSQYGTVLNAYNIIDFYSQKASGKGFVLYENQKSAQSAVDAHIEFKGDKIFCEMSKKLEYLNEKMKIIGTKAKRERAQKSVSTNKEASTSANQEKEVLRTKTNKKIKEKKKSILKNLNFKSEKREDTNLELRTKKIREPDRTNFPWEKKSPPRTQKLMTPREEKTKAHMERESNLINTSLREILRCNNQINLNHSSFNISFKRSTIPQK